jgi:integrase/recombinase XerC
MTTESAERCLLVYSTWLESKPKNAQHSYRSAMGEFAMWYMAEVLQAGDHIPDVTCDTPLETIGIALDDFTSSTQPESHEVCLRYVTWLEVTRNLAPKTIYKKFAGLRNYISMAQDSGTCRWGLLPQIHNPENVRDVSGPGPDGCAKIIAEVESKILDATASGDERKRCCWIRNLALMRLYIDAGLRRFEPLTVEYPTDVDIHGGARIRLLRKGRASKEWIDVNRNPLTVLAISNWIESRGETPGPLFTSMHYGHEGERLSARSINKMISSLGDSIGMKFNCLGLRHTAATSLLDESNGDSRIVAKFLGHNGVGTVHVYDDGREDLARKMGALLDD